MKRYYDPNEDKSLRDEFYDEDFDYKTYRDFASMNEDALFHIGQSYEEKVVDTLYCKKCGGKDFNVGVGSYYTAIKCVSCQWEVCVHEG